MCRKYAFHLGMGAGRWREMSRRAAALQAGPGGGGEALGKVRLGGDLAAVLVDGEGDGDILDGPRLAGAFLDVVGVDGVADLVLEEPLALGGSGGGQHGGDGGGEEGVELHRDCFFVRRTSELL